MNMIKQFLLSVALLTCLESSVHAQIKPGNDKIRKQVSKHLEFKHSPKLSTTCEFFTLEFNLLSTVIKTWSTYDLSTCTEEEFAPFTSTSVRAQVESLTPVASVALGGPYYQMADVNMSKVGTKFVEVGKLKFAMNGVGRFDLIDGLKQPEMFEYWWSKQFRFIPFRTMQDLELIWFKGSEVYELIAKSGETYLMALGTQVFMDYLHHPTDHSNFLIFLNLPEGWRFRKRILEADHIVFVNSDEGYKYARVMDQLGNVYVQTAAEPLKK
jgi:hypothetical protein